MRTLTEHAGRFAPQRSDSQDSAIVGLSTPSSCQKRQEATRTKGHSQTACIRLASLTRLAAPSEQMKCDRTTLRLYGLHDQDQVSASIKRERFHCDAAIAAIRARYELELARKIAEEEAAFERAVTNQVWLGDRRVQIADFPFAVLVGGLAMLVRDLRMGDIDVEGLEATARDQLGLVLNADALDALDPILGDGASRSATRIAAQAVSCVTGKGIHLLEAAWSGYERAGRAIEGRVHVVLDGAANRDPIHSELRRQINKALVARAQNDAWLCAMFESAMPVWMRLRLWLPIWTDDRIAIRGESAESQFTLRAAMKAPDESEVSTLLADRTRDSREDLCREVRIFELHVALVRARAMLAFDGSQHVSGRDAIEAYQRGELSNMELDLVDHEFTFTRSAASNRVIGSSTKAVRSPKAARAC